jgi:hypothetical protein
MPSWYPQTVQVGCFSFQSGSLNKNELRFDRGIGSALPRWWVTFILLVFQGQVKGNVTYNGHRLSEFVPQKTSVYISQQDLHVAEMTVHETLDFSARCQGIGTRYGE